MLITVAAEFPSIIVEEIKDVSFVNKNLDASTIVFASIDKFSTYVPGETIIVSPSLDSSIAG